MKNHYLLNEIKSHHINDVIEDKLREFAESDLDFWENKGNIHYHFVLDANEVRNYCFPIAGNATIDEYNLSKIIDSQIAYNYIFELRKPKPIIFEEYGPELKSLAYFLDNISGSIYSEASLFTNFFENIKNIYFSKGISLKDKDLQISFNLSLLNFGASRLSKVYKSIKLSSDFEYHEADLNRYNNIKESLVNRCYNSLINEEYEVTKNSVRRDVSVISKVIMLNNFNIQNDNSNDLYIYVSSARNRTKIFLKELKLSGFFCEINQIPFNIWRQPLQIFQFLINRVVINSKNDDLLIDVKNSMINLRRLKHGLEDIESITKNKSAVNGDILDILDRIYNNRRNAYLRDLKEFENYSLENKNLPYYDLFSVDKLIGIAKNTFDDDDLKIAREIIKGKENYEFNLETLIRLRNTIGIKQSLNEIIPKRESYTSNHHIGELLDTIPILLVFSNSDYNIIFLKILNYWELFYLTSSKSKKDTKLSYIEFITIIDEVVEMEEATSEISFEHEFLGIILLLVSPNIESDETALRKIERLKKINILNPAYITSLNYLYTATLRLNNRFYKAIEYSSTLILLSPDYKLKWEFVLSVYQYLITVKDFRKSEAVRYSRRALSYFDELRSTIKLQNNFQNHVEAYLLSIEIFLKSNMALINFDLELLMDADNDLLNLKKMVPKESWFQIYKNFVYSEVFFEYASASLFFRFGLDVKPRTTWDIRIMSAKSDLGRIIRTSISTKKEVYIDLRNKVKEIEKHL